MISLQARLNRGLIAILLTVFVLHWVAADFVIKRVAEDQMATRLEHDSDSLRAFFGLESSGVLHFSADHLGLVYQQLDSGHYFVIETAGSVFRSESLGDTGLSTKPVDLGKSCRYHLKGPKGQPLLVLTTGLSNKGQVINLTVAEDLTDLNQAVDGIRLSYLGFTLIVLIIAINLQTADVRRSLKPLRTMRDEVKKVVLGQSSQITSPAPKEVSPLVDEINRLLKLVERRLLQSRRAIGNLAHSLKTPLAVLYRLHNEPLLQQKPSLKALLEEQTGAIHWRVETELKRARLSGSVQPGAGFNPQQDLTDLFGLLGLQYAEKNLHFDLSASDAITPFDREDMLELVGNLADNACKWAKSKVSVQAEWKHGHLTLVVADDGPGCQEEDLADLTERGIRADENTPGHGLGLSIVSDIVEFYGGTMLIGHAKLLGGFMVRIRL